MSNTKVKRGPGRPKGSKNKVKSISTVVKRGRGRPKGSKNKITANNVSSVKRGRGRPKGSKNKVEIDEEMVCGIEHHMNKQFTDALCTMLKHPRKCPHDNDIPIGDCCTAQNS